MTRAGIIRCEKNEHRCPLTSCLNCLLDCKEGFAGYRECRPAGIFTCRCPGDDVGSLAKILKAKGADVIHICTCTFARKSDRGWTSVEGGFCDRLEAIVERIGRETGLPVVKGTAHLPKDGIPDGLSGSVGGTVCHEDQQR